MAWSSLSETFFFRDSDLGQADGQIIILMRNMEIDHLSEICIRSCGRASRTAGRCGARWETEGRKSVKSADKPGSVYGGCPPLTVIPLGRPSLTGSSSLPGRGASHTIASLFGLAPDGGCRAVRVATSAVRSYRTVSPLPAPLRVLRRFVFCCPVHRLTASGR